MDVNTLQQTVVAALEDIKARDIEVIDTSRLTPLFDRVIVCLKRRRRRINDEPLLALWLKGELRVFIADPLNVPHVQAQ